MNKPHEDAFDRSMHEVGQSIALDGSSFEISRVQPKRSDSPFQRATDSPSMIKEKVTSRRHSERDSDRISDASEGDRLGDSVSLLRSPRRQEQSMFTVGPFSAAKLSPTNQPNRKMFSASSRNLVDREVDTLNLSQSNNDSLLRKQRLAGFNQMTDMPRHSVKSLEKKQNSERKSVPVMRTPKLEDDDGDNDFDESNLMDDDIAEFKPKN